MKKFYQFFSEEKNNKVRIFKEACFMGLMLVLFGYLSSIIVKPFLHVSLPDVCKGWNRYYVMEISLFTAGFMLHIFLEWIGANKRYAEYRNKI